MTRQAGTTTLTSDRLMPGTYQGYTGSNYLFMDLIIRDASGYDAGHVALRIREFCRSGSPSNIADAPSTYAHTVLRVGPELNAADYFAFDPYFVRSNN